MTFTNRDFIDWKASNVSKAVFDHLRQRITDVGTELTYEAGQDPGRDRFKAGYIQALRDALEIDFNDAEAASGN